MMKLFLAPLAIAAPLLSPSFQDDHTVARDIIPRGVGLTMFVPENGTARELLSYAKEMTPTKFMVTEGTGRQTQLDRMIVIRNAIGIQGTEADRQVIHDLLLRLDKTVGSLEPEGKGEPPQKEESRALRLRTMSPDSAVALVQGLGMPVNAHVVEETGTVVLSGYQDAVNVAQHMIVSADEPLPQMTLYCEIIKAVPEGSIDESKRIVGDVAGALSAVAPGMGFERRGRVMVRSSVGGRRSVEVSTDLPGITSDPNDPSPRMRLTAMPAAWDGETKTLSLRRCNVELETPNFSTVEVHAGVSANHPAARQAIQRSFNGYRSQGLSADLALRAGETTIVGSLGGTPHFVAMRFTVD